MNTETIQLETTSVVSASEDKALTPDQRFWRLLKPDTKEIKDIYTYAIFNGLIGLSLPLGIQAIVNLIQGGQVNTAWIVLVIFVVFGVAIMGVLQIYQLRISENLQQKVFTRAAFEFGFRIPRVKMEELYRHYAPELMNRFFDTISVQKGLPKILIDFSSAALSIIFGLILLSFYHPFFIAFSVLLLLLLAAIFRFTWRRGLTSSLEESNHKYRLAHWLEELARTGTTFKLAGKTILPLEKVDGHVTDYLTARERHFGILISQYSFMVLFKVTVAAGLLAIGGILVMEQRMNIGQFVAAEIIILTIMSAVESLIKSFETIYDVLTALEKIGQVTDLELEPSEGTDLNAYESEEGMRVHLHGVNFAYPGKYGLTLNDLNVDIAPGEKIAVTGGSGAGKSTLLHIVAGLYQVQSGVISYDGIPIGNLDLETLRASIGDCLTQEELFEGTLFENIAMGRDAATMENVRWAIENVGLADFVGSLPKGYNTIMSPQGKTLPRSIIQKLLVARSIADKPRLLLLEDALERVDPQERHDIIDFLTAKDKPWTLMVVSNDEYFAQRADKCVQMVQGRIVNICPFSELNNN